MAGSTIVITYDGVDITNKVLFSSATFDAQANAQPGTFEFTVKDIARTQSFVTGKEITLSLDGQKLWAGYLTAVSPKFALPVVETTNVGDVTERQFVLRGVDYNILFDKRVLRNTANYLTQLPTFDKQTYDGDLIRNSLSSFIDLPAGFDLTTYVDNVAPPFDPLNEGLEGEGTWVQQGTTWRDQLKDFSQFSGAVWYLDADKKLHWHAIESVHALWGFSDHPNNAPISGSTPPGAALYGFRDLDATEDGSTLVNDALIWGGSEWAGAGGTVFARAENTDSQTIHSRWQMAETHFGELGFGVQSGVTARANEIVYGSPSGIDNFYGLRYPQWQIRFGWFGHDVPLLTGTPKHLKPGDLVTIALFVFGTDIYHPLIQTLPMRQLRITFPGLDKTGKPYVRFDGFFGLQTGDPFTIWRYLTQPSLQEGIRQNVVATAPADGSTTPVYGSFYSDSFANAPTGSTVIFDLKNSQGYIAGTTQVYINGALQRPGYEYTESDPEDGQVTFASPPAATDDLWIICRLR